MIRYVVDASLAVEYLLRTELGTKIAPLIEQAYLYAPDLLDVEVLSAFKRAVRQKRLTDDRAQQAIDDLKAWPIQRTSHQDLIHLAWEFKDNLSIYDAMYVATAKLVDAPLLTSDGPLSRAKVKGILVQSVV